MNTLSKLVNRKWAMALLCAGAFFAGFFTSLGAEAEDAQAQAIGITVHGGRLLKLSEPAVNVFVADPEIADVQVPAANSIYVLGKRAGRTNIYALNEKGDAILAISVTVAHDVGALKGIFTEEFPGEAVTARSVPGGIVIAGEVSSDAEADHAVALVQSFLGEGDRVINQIEVRTPNQVNLRVRVAEMSRDVAKQLGFNWDSTFDDGTFSLGLLTNNVSSIPNSNSITGTFGRGNFDLMTMVDALAREGVITTLAEPNLTAISGETASFLAGGEFPIPIAHEDNKITVQFKPFGVALDFTPTVLSPERISLKVRPEVSQISDEFSITTNDIEIPGITVRRAETTVELASGQSFAIAGLMDNRTASSISKLPGIGDLPVLGPLFQSSEFRHNESELIILVTPFIVEPMRIAHNEIITPLDQYRPATDIERIFGQKIIRAAEPPGKAGPAGDSGLHLLGDAGFYY